MKIEIQERLINKIEERVKKQGKFKDAEEYINFILEQVVNKLQKFKEEPKSDSESIKKEEEIKKKLSELGYM